MDVGGQEVSRSKPGNNIEVELSVWTTCGTRYHEAIIVMVSARGVKICFRRREQNGNPLLYCYGRYGNVPGDLCDVYVARTL